MFRTFCLLAVAVIISPCDSACPSWNLSRVNAFGPQFNADLDIYVYADLDKNVHGLDSCRGREVWTRNGIGWSLASGTLNGEPVIFVANLNVSVSAVKMETGEVIWTEPRTDYPNGITMILFTYDEAGKQLITADYQWRLTAFSAETGKMTWKSDASSSMKHCVSSSLASQITVVADGFIVPCNQITTKFSSSGTVVRQASFGDVVKVFENGTILMYERNYNQSVRNLRLVTNDFAEVWSIVPRQALAGIAVAGASNLLLIENYFAVGNPIVVIAATLLDVSNERYTAPALIGSWRLTRPGQDLYSMHNLILDDTGDVAFFGFFGAEASQTMTVVAAIAVATPRVVRSFELPTNPDFSLDYTDRGGVYLRWRIDAPEQWLYQPRFITANDPIWVKA